MPSIENLLLRLSLIVAVTLSVTACGPQEFGCDLRSVQSMIVTLVDGDGNVLLPEEGTIMELSKDGGTTWSAGCELYNGRFSCGGDGGTFSVRTEYDGLSGMTSGIRVTENRCHPNTVEVELLMQ